MIRNNMPIDSPSDDMTDDPVAGPHAQLIAQAQRVRATIGSRRSDKLLRLFDFLLERTLEGRAPTELEIANEAFSIGPVIDAPQDATVRVYVHRLRKSLEQSQADMPGPKIFIPKGEYMLVLSSEGDEAAAPIGEDVVSATPAARRGVNWWAILSVVVIINAAAWWWFASRKTVDLPPALTRTALWQAIGQGGRPITLVIGDYYLFAENDPEDVAKAVEGPRRLVRDPSINGREDLDIYLMNRPAERKLISDFDMRYVPSSVVTSLGDIFSVVRAIRGQTQRRVTLIPASQVNTDLLKSSDIIYVGQLSGLGTLLRNPLFQASGFKVGSTYDELIDGPSGRRFQSDGGLVLADERVARRDFGYLASFPGPSGNHIVIVAGARDAAVRQMAEVAHDARRLDQLNGKATSGAQGFEALYQVRALGNLNISGQLLTARPLQSRGIWDRATPSQRFPNDDFEGDGHGDR